MSPYKNNNELHPWVWFTDRVLPSLFIAVALSVGGAAWWTHQSVNDLMQKLQTQQTNIGRLESRLDKVETAMVSKQELLETLKRVEQQLEIMMLRAGIQSKVRVSE